MCVCVGVHALQLYAQGHCKRSKLLTVLEHVPSFMDSGTLVVHVQVFDRYVNKIRQQLHFCFKQVVLKVRDVSSVVCACV